MKKPARLLALLVTMFVAVPAAHAEITPGELVAPKMEISDGNLNFTIQPSVSGRNYQLQWSDSMAGGTWQDVGVLRSGDGGNIVISTPHLAGVEKRFYRIALVEATAAPAGFSLISAGSFLMGDQSNSLGYDDELPVHSVFVSAFFMAKYEVTKEEWDTVRAWALINGYTDLAAGNGGTTSKGVNHPVHSITWFDMVKWCNARSEKENLSPCYTDGGATYKIGQIAPDCNWSASGYRLPTEAEREKAARGGLSAKNFPWGDTISHNQANYVSSSSYAYDVSPTRDYHPTYALGDNPYSSPVGSFAPNGYGLYDMAGNMSEWCWDWHGSYSAGPQTDPHGAASGLHRVLRGGSWGNIADYCRVARRNADRSPANLNDLIGLRVAQSLVP